MWRAIGASAVAGCAWLLWRRQRAEGKTPLHVCWLSNGSGGEETALRLASEVGSCCSFVVKLTPSLSEVPPSTDVLICGDPNAYADASEWLGKRLRRLSAVIVPYAGVHPSIRSCCIEANKVRVREGLRRLLVVNSHHNAAMTAEFGVALALAAAKRVPRGDRELRNNDWRGRGIRLKGAPDPVPVVPQLILDGKTALMVGFGAVGRRMALSFAALGCRVVAITRSIRHVETRRVQRNDISIKIRVYPSQHLLALLPTAALVVLCVPLSAETRGLISEAAFNAMRSDAVLVNVARGPVVDQDALIAALQQQKIGCYASDVWWNYPDDWSTAANCPPFRDQLGQPVKLPPDLTLMSPHRGGAIGLAETEDRRLAALAAGLRRAATHGSAVGLAIPPLGLVDLDSGY